MTMFWAECLWGGWLANGQSPTRFVDGVGDGGCWEVTTSGQSCIFLR